ncbi:MULTISPECIES: PTS sugar transporter subunit IIA [unclassified Oceanispirochaeta]|uniref:PTS sugar transporter subunit IIA n=1 Tax=unclassified Oceanispirochaeta TaxID=2635722 RepID=UPI000E098338|nr:MULTISPECIES: PTS sugar transporter subunit IIA [unclassified Oceanispirochaeta]MBF9014433.1 PTS sugar transporter subunit IIA [Oceanispirochaeta sp. M2]NPD74987.1 PTS sugar transporter subunit IIA [Oceanispirochaeta sp. M1]RDG29163.1 PTS sugar transporter subunit IIA [Oceanispirochaeta sp. M1]
MTLDKFLKQDNCIILNSKTKTEAFHEMIDLVKDDSLVKDIENLKKEIFYREQIMSTGIGQGIGIPHVRFGSIKEPQVYVGISPEGLNDYDSIDNVPVKIVIMILVGAEQHKEYLRTLSLIVGRLKNEEIIKSLFQVTSANEILPIFIGEE